MCSVSASSASLCGTSSFSCCLLLQRKPPPSLKPPWKHAYATPTPSGASTPLGQRTPGPSATPHRPCALGPKPHLGRPPLHTLWFLPTSPKRGASPWDAPMCVGHTRAELRGMTTQVVWVAHAPPNAAPHVTGLVHSVHTRLAHRASLVVPRVTSQSVRSQPLLMYGVILRTPP